MKKPSVPAYVPIQNQEGLARDTATKVVINTNIAGRSVYQAQVAKFRENQELKQKLERMEKNQNEMMDIIKQLLKDK